MEGWEVTLGRAEASARSMWPRLPKESRWGVAGPPLGDEAFEPACKQAVVSGQLCSSGWHLRHKPAKELPLIAGTWLIGA